MDENEQKLSQINIFDDKKLVEIHVWNKIILIVLLVIVATTLVR